MATKSSGELTYPGTYTLGEYSFTIVRTAGSGDATITAYCSKGTDQGSKSITVSDSYNIDGWYIEANDTTADVYVKLSSWLDPFTIKTLPKCVLGNIDSPHGRTFGTWDDAPASAYYIDSNGHLSTFNTSSETIAISDGTTDLFASIGNSFSSYGTYYPEQQPQGYYAMSSSGASQSAPQYTKDGKSVYYFTLPHRERSTIPVTAGATVGDNGRLAWYLVYGVDPLDDALLLVGRFAIDVEDAGGTGTDSDWDDPGDVYIPDPDDPEWEPDPDPPDPEDMLTLDLDNWAGAPGDTFVATISGSTGESMAFRVYDENGHTYYSATVAGSESDVTVSFTTADSWMGGQGCKGFTVSATTAETNRTATDAFTLEVEEPDPDDLMVDVDPDEGYAGDVLVATISGHMGQRCQCVIENSYGRQVASYNVAPADDSTDATLNITLTEAWLTDYTLQEAFTLTVTAADGREASCGFCLLVEEPEPDPERILKITVNGASAGTGSGYTPAENNAKAGYGCGGDGGHGGGGGAGGSNIVVFKFTTDRADSHEVTTIVKSPGSGSAGGKGAKGGDGCILIYY